MEKFKDELGVSEIRKIFETLVGNMNPQFMPKTLTYLTLMRSYKRNLYYFLWLIRNGVTGDKLYYFFLEQNGVVNAVNYIHSRRFGSKFSIEKVKADELV